jgi:Tfp pilus assembly PilM family ATPase
MRVFGLDISKDAVACVEVETAFGRFEIRNTYESPRPQPGGVEADPHVTASNLLRSIPGKPGRVITCSPVEIGTFRNLQLATRDKKAIRAALAFELEDDLPFDAGNLHYDYAILPSQEPGSLVHVGAVKKDSFEAHLNTLQNNQMDPEVITTDAWAYRSLFTRIQKPLQKGETGEVSLLIGLERNKTFFYVNGRNRPLLYREIPFGLAYIERLLQERTGASPSEIKSYIQDIGVTGINEQVSSTILEALDHLIPEIKQVELASRSQIRAPFDQIHITGEGALLPGLMDWLSSATDSKCVLFRPLSLLSASQVTYSDMTEIRFGKALALAMTQVPLDKVPALNLRKGIFAKSGSSDLAVLELIQRPLPYLLVTALVFLATKGIEYSYYKSRISEMNDSLRRSVKAYYGNVSDSAARTYMADIGKLKRNIEGELSKERELAKLFTPNANSPLLLLNSISEKIGRDVVVDLVKFDAGSENNERFSENKTLGTNLTFIVANAQALSRLSEIIEKNFALKRGKSEEITREGRKVLKVVFSGTFGGRK